MRNIQGHKKARREFWIGIGIGALILMLSIRLDLLEQLYAMSRSYERLELDEWIVLGLFWCPYWLYFACRRWREANRMRRELEVANTVLERNGRSYEGPTKWVQKCAACKRIETAQGAWLDTATYMAKEYGVQATHGLCPECQEEEFKPSLAATTVFHEPT